MEAITQFATENRWVVETFVIVLLTAIVRMVVKFFFDRLAKQLAKTHNLYDDALLDATRKPLGVAIWVIGISFAAETVGGANPAEVFEHVGTLREVAVVAILVWFALRFIKFIESQILSDEYGERAAEVDSTTVQAVGKLLRATVIITGVLLVLQTFGFSISGVLAFGGIGGIAIGFAARDLLANFFGALMIFLDRPFSVGDWVRSPDRELEGTVEDIGWRLTRIRTFDKRPLYVPNAVFANIALENPSRMHNRRINETIGIRYDDIAVMKDVVADVEQMLKDHEDIDTSQTLMVNFVKFGPSSLDFFIYCFTKTIVWAEFHKVKQDVMLRIAEIIDQHGAEIAFPTQTLHIQAEPDQAEAEEADKADAGQK